MNARGETNQRSYTKAGNSIIKSCLKICINATGYYSVALYIFAAGIRVATAIKWQNMIHKYVTQ